METTIEEKRTLAAFGCRYYQNTIKRLCVAATLTQNAKVLFCELAMRLSQKDYCIIINSVHMEMEIYNFAV